jgi:hypothetical protein
LSSGHARWPRLRPDQTPREAHGHDLQLKSLTEVGTPAKHLELEWICVVRCGNGQVSAPISALLSDYVSLRNSPALHGMYRRERARQFASVPGAPVATPVNNHHVRKSR